MAFNKRLLWTFWAFIFVPSLQGVYGAMVCEKLHREVCAFSVSTSGTRCVLEKSILSNGDVQYDCQSSEVIADEITEWIETVECTNACGSERMTVGMSSDALMEGGFVTKLCSPRCYNNCPNIVDLYFNLAAGEEAETVGLWARCPSHLLSLCLQWLFDPLEREAEKCCTILDVFAFIGTAIVMNESRPYVDSKN